MTGEKHIHADESCRCVHEHEHCECGHGHEHEHAHEHENKHAGSEAHTLTGRNVHIYTLENLGCANCAAKMEAKIRELRGVEDAAVIYATKQLRLKCADPAALLGDIRKICTGLEPDVRVIERSANAQEKKRGFFAGNFELWQIIIGAALFIAGEISLKLGAPNAAVLIINLAAYLLLGTEILIKAAKGLFRGHALDENLLMSLAAIGAFIIGEYPEAVGVMLFFRIGEYFEERAVEKSRRQIMDAVDLRPETVTVLSGGESSVIPAAEAQAGDIILVRPGDRIPLDGSVLDGESRIDTSAITGEPVPVSVKAGDGVFSGCVNLSGRLTLRVEKPLEESMVTKILRSVENAAASKPKTERFITRFARVYTPLVVIAAAITAIAPPLLFSGEWRQWIYTALTFLVMSCPCALVLSVPLAFFSGIGAGSKRGILFKGGAAIESLNRVKAVVMDKTGTLTLGRFEVRRLIPAENTDKTELLRLAACSESSSSHPIGASICAEAAARKIAVSAPQSVKELPGRGIVAELDGARLICGSRRLLEESGISVPDGGETFGTEVFLARNGEFLGRIVIADLVKPEARAAVSELNRRKIAAVMLTGDEYESARAVANEVGISDVRAKLLPQEKLTELEKIRREHGAAMFVGDGINDAPVLAGADVGAAMGSGADAAIEAADVVFMTSGADAIPQSISIARRASRVSLQNVVFALAVKLAVMVLGLFGFASMWAAVFADSGVAMLCVINSVRVLYSKR